MFGDRTGLKDDPPISPLARPTQVFVGPELACHQTARFLGEKFQEQTDLVGPDFGRWAGRRLADVVESEPVNVHAWMRDSTIAPHGGESLETLTTRIGAVLDSRQWSAAETILVVTPWVARAALVHVMGASSDAIFRVDVAPLGAVAISQHAGQWRVTSLRRSVQV